MAILVTGAAGFIGFHVCQRLLLEGHEVFGLDNVNDYYDPELKEQRIKQLRKIGGFRFYWTDLLDEKNVFGLFRIEKISHVVHLAAQAGVRYSLENPQAYVNSNVSGFLTLLEAIKRHTVEHLVYASSSSVYGLNTPPFHVDMPVDCPGHFYGVTKRTNELMAYSYSQLYGIKCSGLRYFTVYGEWGRPDMAFYRFASNMTQGKPIDLYNYGEHVRSFTYVSDAVDATLKTLWNAPESTQVLNVGGGQPVALKYAVGLLEECLGIKAELNMLPMQKGDIQDALGISSFPSKVPIEIGLPRFVDWFKSYHINKDYPPLNRPPYL